MSRYPTARRPAALRSASGGWPAPATLCLLASIVALVLAAQGGDEQEAERIALGRISYRVFCSNCHGEGGHGDGPVAEFLTIEPTDLTRIPADPEGGFPSERLAEIIDGRVAVEGHGRREMPVWGLSFQERGRDSDQEAEVKARIGRLVAYLQSIQEEPETDRKSEELKP